MTVWLIGWLKPIMAVFFTVAVVIGIYSFYVDMKREKTESGCNLKISFSSMIIVGVIVFLWLVISGHGAFFPQPSDWHKHNCILNDLVKREWPVYYHNDNSNAMLTYYIGQYLMPSLCGKFFGGKFRVAELAVLMWNFIGVYIAILLFFRLANCDTKKKQVLSVFLFIFFSTPLFLGRAIYSLSPISATDIPKDLYWISSSVRILYRSISNSVRWIPNGSIVPWIATALFADELSPRHYVLIAVPLLLCSTFSFVGLALLMLGVFFAKLLFTYTTSMEKADELKNCATISNICAILVALPIIVYLSGNVLSEKPKNIIFDFIYYTNNTIVYIAFVFTFSCYSMVLFKNYKTNILFYVVNIFLFILPLFRMGKWNDLCMNASIPAIFILAFFVIKSLFEYLSCAKKNKRMILLIGLLFFGSLYPAYEFLGILKTKIAFDGSNRYWVGGVESMENYARRDGSVGVDYAYNYYTYDYETSAFYRYFARKK